MEITMGSFVLLGALLAFVFIPIYQSFSKENERGITPNKTLIISIMILEFFILVVVVAGVLVHSGSPVSLHLIKLPEQLILPAKIAATPLVIHLMFGLIRPWKGSIFETIAQKSKFMRFIVAFALLDGLAQMYGY